MQARRSVISLAARDRCLRQSNPENNIVSAGQDRSEAARECHAVAKGLQSRAANSGREKGEVRALAARWGPRRQICTRSSTRSYCPSFKLASFLRQPRLAQADPAAHMIERRPRNADSSRLCDAFQPRRDIDPVAQHVLAVDLIDPLSWRQRWRLGTAVGEAKLGRSSSGGEDWHWEGDVRQFPQILCGGGQ
jgi:hypothetical protein